MLRTLDPLEEFVLRVEDMDHVLLWQSVSCSHDRVFDRFLFHDFLPIEKISIILHHSRAILIRRLILVHDKSSYDELSTPRFRFNARRGQSLRSLRTPSCIECAIDNSQEFARGGDDSVARALSCFDSFV